MRANQNGSIISFVIVSAVLILGATGLFYWVGHGLQASPATEPEVKISAPSEPEKKPVKDTPPSNDTTSEDTSAQPGEQTETDSQATNPTPSVSELSRTGPEETMTALIVIGLLVGFSVAYVQSRRTSSL